MKKVGSNIGRVTRVALRNTVKKSWYYEITDGEGTVYKHIGRKYIDLELYLGQVVEFFANESFAVSLVRDAEPAALENFLTTKQ